MSVAAEGRRPLVVGLTGSIGMGKTTVAGMLRELGVPVFDADAEVHRLQGPGGALLPAIEDAFPGTTGPEGVDRVRLRDAVMGDDAALKRLEGIVHPAVAQGQRAFLDANANAAVVVLDIPLLFEKGGHALVDRIVTVSAPADVQRARVLARPGMTDAAFEAILARQTPDADKRARSHHVIDTGAPIAETRAAVASLVACLTAEAGA